MGIGNIHLLKEEQKIAAYKAEGAIYIPPGTEEKEEEKPEETIRGKKRK